MNIKKIIVFQMKLKISDNLSELSNPFFFQIPRNKDNPYYRKNNIKTYFENNIHQKLLFI